MAWSKTRVWIRCIPPYFGRSDVLLNMFKSIHIFFRLPSSCATTTIMWVSLFKANYFTVHTQFHVLQDLILKVMNPKHLNLIEEDWGKSIRSHWMRLRSARVNEETIQTKVSMIHHNTRWESKSGWTEQTSWQHKPEANQTIDMVWPLLFDQCAI